MGGNKIYLFVYGTLREHEQHAHLLTTATKLASQAWVSGRLYDTGFGFPGLVKQKGSRVYGELYKLSKQMLAIIDQLEEYVPGRTGNLFTREQRKVYTDFGKVRAYVYIYQGDVQEERVIPSGDWRVNQLIKQPYLLYFAYGSCMDNERFRQAGVEENFKDMLGRGILKGYQLKYTRIAREGGRADIVETRKKREVQGKVYRISKETLPYLFKREGVEASLYRPAVVGVELNGKLLPNVLTFIVVNKKKDTAPPYSYVEEIIRGGYGTVSDQYLLQQINYLKTKHRLNIRKLKQQLYKKTKHSSE